MTATAVDREWLRAAVELSRRCPRSDSAYAVGAILVGADGVRLADGYSREHDPHEHAEEAALAALGPTSPDALAGATLYSSLEPCSTRRSRPRSCVRHILAAGIGRVVFALREPPVFVDCNGADLLREAGVEVVQVVELAPLVRQVNAHVLGPANGPA